MVLYLGRCRVSPAAETGWLETGLVEGFEHTVQLGTSLVPGKVVQKTVADRHAFTGLQRRRVPGMNVQPDLHIRPCREVTHDRAPFGIGHHGMIREVDDRRLAGFTEILKTGELTD